MNKVLFWIFVLFSAHVCAQPAPQKCGYELVKQSIVSRDPSFQTRLDQFLENRKLQQALPNARMTGGVTLNVTVPVVFHIILDTQQLHRINDSAGISERGIRQIAVLNQDYNRGNEDSSLIPSVFKPFYGNVNIRFGLAHTDPQGQPTSGWDIHVTNYKGFDASTTDPCVAAKYHSLGGVDAWDATRYVNVWVINFLYGNQPANILGLTIPPDLTTDTTTGFPPQEMGVLLSYSVFGNRYSPSEYFYTSFDRGRTLTHEMGHYFGLYHTWGDDGGLCPSEPYGKDDGIADTPPEGGPNYGCPTFPVYDNCSTANNGNGIMFNNYMDYTDDACMNMFTHGQALVMEGEIQPGGISHQLTLHPELLQYPGNIQPTSDNSFVITPNPSSGNIYISFNQVPTGFQSITVKNILGQTAFEENTSAMLTSYFPINLSTLGKGLYFVTCRFAQTAETRKIMLL